MNKISDQPSMNPVSETDGLPQRKQTNLFSQDRDLDREAERFACLMEKPTSKKDPSSQATREDGLTASPQKGEKKIIGGIQGKDAQEKLPEGKDAPEKLPEGKNTQENLPEGKNRRLPEEAGESLQSPMSFDTLYKTPLQALRVPGAVQTVNRASIRQPSSPTRGVSETARAVAERILVAEPSLVGKQEVRITLKDSVLPQTEIRISKEGDKLTIDIVTTSDHSYRIISQEKNGLQQVLAERLDPRITVEVAVSDTGREQNQGRSRQQRNVFEEWQP
ncbi:MAG: type III secretion HpaP family protein [Pseudomonadota bacterium]